MFEISNLKNYNAKLSFQIFIQLSLNSFQLKFSIILTFMNINFEKLEFDNLKFQLN